MIRNDEDVRQADESETLAESVGRGIGALLAVAVVVGLLFGAGALLLVKLSGLGGSDSTTASDSSAGATLYMPEPDAPSKPVVQQTQPTTQAAEEPKIVLAAAPTTVAAMGKVTFTGTYAGGVGTVLQVERKEGDAWAAFSGISTTVQPDGTFSTWIQTGRSGASVFRITDQDKALSSNGVTVTVG